LLERKGRIFIRPFLLAVYIGYILRNELFAGKGAYRTCDPVALYAVFCVG
jgi:hypothetical protein